MQNGDSIVDIPLQKDKIENMMDEKEDEKGANTNFNNNIINNGEFLEQSSNSKEEEKQPVQEEIENEEVCNRCKEKLGDDWKKPHWKWNMDKNKKFCINCYKIKETEHEKIINYCIMCDSKLKFLRYNPRPEWGLKGQLCRKCWDFKNTTYKSENLKK